MFHVRVVATTPLGVFSGCMIMKEGTSEVDAELVRDTISSTADQIERLVLIQDDGKDLVLLKHVIQQSVLVVSLEEVQ